MDYQELIKYSHELSSQQFERGDFLLYDETQVTPMNISIVCRADGDFKEKLLIVLNGLSKHQSHHFIYPIENVHSTIAYFPSEGIDVDVLLGILKTEIVKYDIEYFHHGFLPSPRGDGLVGILEPKDEWRFKIASSIEHMFGINQGKKMDNPVIDSLLRKYARSYLLKFKKMPTEEDINYIKSLYDKSLGSWRPKEICIYRTNSPLLTNAELLGSIQL